jgi:hypothetical protein
MRVTVRHRSVGVAQLFLCLTEGVSGFRHERGGRMTEVMDGRRRLDPSPSGGRLEDTRSEGVLPDLCVPIADEDKGIGIERTTMLGEVFLQHLTKLRPDVHCSPLPRLRFGRDLSPCYLRRRLNDSDDAFR